MKTGSEKMASSRGKKARTEKSNEVNSGDVKVYEWLLEIYVYRSSLYYALSKNKSM